MKNYCNVKNEKLLPSWIEHEQHSLERQPCENHLDFVVRNLAINFMKHSSMSSGG